MWDEFDGSRLVTDDDADDENDDDDGRSIRCSRARGGGGPQAASRPAGHPGAAARQPGPRGARASGTAPTSASASPPRPTQWSQQSLVVVACGDIKRGKSSLLNALLDRSDLLPVDADVATSVHLVIRHGETVRRSSSPASAIDGEPAQESIDGRRSDRRRVDARRRRPTRGRRQRRDQRSTTRCSSAASCSSTRPASAG